MRAVRQGVKALARYFGREMPDIFLCCAETYGNTTTTSHFVALHEFMLSGRVNPGDNLLLVSGASGIVISHATLTSTTCRSATGALGGALRAREWDTRVVRTPHPGLPGRTGLTMPYKRGA